MNFLIFSISQTIEDLKQNLNELNEKFHNRQNLVDQLNIEMTKLKQKLEQSEIRLQQFQVCLNIFPKKKQTNFYLFKLVN